MVDIGPLRNVSPFFLLGAVVAVPIALGFVRAGGIETARGAGRGLAEFIQDPIGSIFEKSEEAGRKRGEDIASSIKSRITKHGPPAQVPIITTPRTRGRPSFRDPLSGERRDTGQFLRFFGRDADIQGRF